MLQGIVRYLKPIEEWLRQLKARAYAKYIATVFLVLVVTVSLLLAAHFSLPGSALYALKLAITEPIADFFVFTNEAKLKRETERIQTRAEEVITLVTGSGILPKDRVALEKELTERSSEVRNRIDTLQASGDVAGALRAASEFEVTLSGLETIFLEVRTTISGVLEQIDPVGEKIEKALVDITQVRSAFEGKLLSENRDESHRSEAEEALVLVDRTMAEFNEYIDANAALLKDAAFLGVKGNYKVAEDLRRQSREKLDTGEFGASLQLAYHAYRVAAQEHLILDIRIRLLNR